MPRMLLAICIWVAIGQLPAQYIPPGGSSSIGIPGFAPPCGVTFSSLGLVGHWNLWNAAANYTDGTNQVAINLANPGVSNMQSGPTTGVESTDFYAGEQGAFLPSASYGTFANPNVGDKFTIMVLG